MELQIIESFSEAEGTWKIGLGGEVDVSTAGNLRDILSKLFQQKQADIVLDLADLAYIDSTGLGVLIGAFGRMQEKGYGLRIENPRENIAKLLRITSLDKIFCRTE